MPVITRSKTGGKAEENDPRPDDPFRPRPRVFQSPPPASPSGNRSESQSVLASDSALVADMYVTLASGLHATVPVNQSAPASDAQIAHASESRSAFAPENRPAFAPVSPPSDLRFDALGDGFASRSALHGSSSVPTAVEQRVPPRFLPVQKIAHGTRCAAAASVRSTASAIARIRKAEYEAEKRLAELEASLIRKRLAMEVAMIEAQEDTREPIPVSAEENENRVAAWLNEDAPPATSDRAPGTRTGGEASCEMEAQVYRNVPDIGTGMEPSTRNEVHEFRCVEDHRDMPAAASHPAPCAMVPRDVMRYESLKEPYRQTRRLEQAPRRSPSPPCRDDRRQRSLSPHRERDRGLERLAIAVENMDRRRNPPPRQAQELPLFDGDPMEWLTFKAAMEDSMALHGFTQAENLARLRSCLRGKARKVVSALLATATDWRFIVKTLEQAFGRVEVIMARMIENIDQLPRVGKTADELNEFAVNLQNAVCIFAKVDDRGYLRNPELVRKVLDKLSPHVQSKWCDYADEYEASCVDPKNREPELLTLSRFLMKEADRAIRHAYSTAEKSKEPFRKARSPLRVKKDSRDESRRSAAVFTATATNEKQVKEKKCLCCGNEHETAKCKKFHDMNSDERWNWVKGAKICFNCLSNGHRRFSCKAKRCGVKGCRLMHHALLHMDRPLPETPTTSAPEKEEIVMSASVSTAAQERGPVLLKVCPITLTGPSGMQVGTYALLDEGSTISLVDEEVARVLRAEGPAEPLHIHGITSSQREISQRVQLKVQGRASKEEFEIRAFTMKNFHAGVQTVSKECLQHEHLQDLPLVDVCYEKARPRLLIGADNWHLIVSRELRAGRRNEPVASRTLLGWSIHGSAPRAHASEEERVLHIRTHPQEKDIREFSSENEKLEVLMKAHYEVDSLGISLSTRPRKSDARATRIFEETVRHINGRYEVGLPWANDNPRMPTSYEMALRRFKSIEKKMEKTAAFKTAYTAQIKNLLDKGYAELAKGNEKTSDTCWYLPHFGVTNPQKPGKLRLVFDAAARVHGTSLNDCLLDGPDLLKSLPGMLYRFREEKVAVTADIREMFLQIKIRKEDQPAQLFLWREDPKHEVREYVMTSMIFGATSSPFLAHSVRDENARRHGQENPLALKAITQNHYMDDYVDSYPTTAEAVATIDEVRRVHQKGGFVIVGWTSNLEEVLRNVPEGERARQPKEMGKAAQDGRTLGLIWAAETDELLFNTTLPRVPAEVKLLQRPPTKREALSAVMSIFDPLGLLSYMTITAKILLQDLWRQKRIGWDDEIPRAAAEEFATWLKAINDVASLRLRRWYSSSGGVRERQLHVFNDASEQAYATAAYWRIEYEDGAVEVTLAAAKAKVAPIKTQSIPRLELQANLIGARLADSIIDEHRMKPDRTIFWSDSTTALHWIRNDEVRYTPYVAHRLGEIAERTETAQWRWIPTAENVADEATRANFDSKQAEDRWFTGPAFLYEKEEAWPKESPREKITDPETAMHVREERRTEATEGEGLPELARFSSYERLIRTTARVLAFIAMCRRRAKRMEVRHIEEAEQLWIKKAQRESFGEEISRLEKGQPLSSSSKITKLDPILVDGMLRVRGRIDAANVQDETKRPKILDGRHPFTRLLVEDQHKKALHANRERVVNDLRQKYWITRLRPTVRAVERSCRLCQLRKMKPNTPVMGDLPAERLGAYARPFSYCGVDYFGPIIVTVGRRHEKRWCALFTCLTVRAVHLEFVHSLSTDSAIMALRRMAARRGWPRTMWSDNGTNFRGADTELRKAYKEWTPHLRDYGLQHRMEWKFVTPAAPNQGGAWERLVRSVKTSLTAILREKNPKEEILKTLLAEAESCVNSRPLTHVSVDPRDPEALTPNHFLLGGSAGLPTTGPCTAADRRTWRAAQGLADEFWTRWVKEYLPTLLPRGESRGIQTELKEGAPVIIADETLPRNVWPRGVITRTFPGIDGIVRNVEVRTRGGLLRRPLRKIVVLPVNE